MKKLELNQMVNVNGGDQCSRIKRRFERTKSVVRSVKLSMKHKEKCGSLL